MAAHNVCRLLYAERIQADDSGISTIRGRHQAASFIFVVRIRDDPCAVLSVHASPIRVREQMRTSCEKNFNSSHATLKVGPMRHFDEVAFHKKSSMLTA